MKSRITLDLETKAHLLQVLKNYPGAMILVRHEEAFVEKLGVHQKYVIERGRLLKEV
jgi:ATPase subunit of ABC transporter with duplicated ATPase domains